VVASLNRGGFDRAGWHPPLRIARQIHYYSDIVIILAALIVFNWMFNNANSSALIMMLMHAVSAVSNSLFPPMFAAADSVRRSWLLAWTTRCSATPLVDGRAANALLYRF
jgi:hypothetical protein